MVQSVRRKWMDNTNLYGEEALALDEYFRQDAMRYKNIAED